MDIEEIKTFITLSECRNFTRTAEVMHVVQSTVSNRIRSLEQYVGAELVVRDKSGIDLTNEGRVFLDYARRINDLDQTAIYEMNVLKKYTDRLSIAGPQWIMDYLINDSLQDYCLEFKNIAINVSSGHSEDIIPHLKDDVFDFSVLPYRVSTSGITCRLLSKESIVLVAGSSGFGMYRDGVKKEDLLTMPIIYSDIWENYLSDITDGVLTDRSIFKVHTNMLESAKGFCLKGAGCCFLPESMVKKEIERGDLIKIPVFNLPVRKMNIYIVYKSSKASSPALRSWLEYIGMPDPA